MSDRLAVMSGGRIEQVGPPNEVYDNPATEFVAGFLGASNLMAAEVAERHGELTSVRLDGGQTLRIRSERVDGRGSRVRIGVRPEKLVVMPAAESAGKEWNSLEGIISLSVYTGIGHQYTVTDAQGRDFSAYVQNRDVSGAAVQGDAVRIAWRPEHTFVVTPSTMQQQGSATDE
jgi:spermidine/putrescine transport system ATP-binding protein